MTPLVTSVARTDRAGVLDVLRTAFEGPTEAQLVERMWAEDSISAEGLIKSEGNVVAYAAISPVTITLDNKTVADAFGLAPVAVTPEHQRRGHGYALIQALTAALFERRAETLLFVLGDPAYYRRFDFFPAKPFGYQWEGGEVGDAFQVRAAKGAPDPIATTHWGRSAGPCIVHYCDAFRMFDKETA